MPIRVIGLNQTSSSFKFTTLANICRAVGFVTAFTTRSLPGNGPAVASMRAVSSLCFALHPVTATMAMDPAGICTTCFPETLAKPCAVVARLELNWRTSAHSDVVSLRWGLSFVFLLTCPIKFMPSRPGTSCFRLLVTRSSESLTTRIPRFGMVIPKVSTSSSKYPMIFNPLAAANVNYPLVDRRILPLERKFSLKKLSVMVDTSEPESRRHGTRTPPSFTFAIGHLPTARLKTSSLLGTSSGKPVLALLSPGS